MTNNLRQMFVTANNFSETAEFLFEQKDGFLKGYNVPAIINCAFACEVYLKLLLNSQKIDKKTHMLNILLKKLPVELRNSILTELSQKVISMKDAFGRSEIDKISDAFVKWRYNYEYSTLNIETGFLLEFCRTLREFCCRRVFNSTWENCKGKI